MALAEQVEFQMHRKDRDMVHPDVQQVSQLLPPFHDIPQEIGEAGIAVRNIDMRSNESLDWTWIYQSWGEFGEGTLYRKIAPTGFLVISIQGQSDVKRNTMDTTHFVRAVKLWEGEAKIGTYSRMFKRAAIALPQDPQSREKWTKEKQVWFFYQETVPDNLQLIQVGINDYYNSSNGIWYLVKGLDADPVDGSVSFGHYSGPCSFSWKAAVGGLEYAMEKKIYQPPSISWNSF